MRLALIDNYDSFTWDLVEVLRQECPYEWNLLPNDGFDADDILRYDKILISPGPGLPAEWHNLPNLVRDIAGRVDILGVCLGHQAIAEAFGARLCQVGVFHGIQSELIVVENDRLFDGLSSPILIGRYHSWVVDESSLPQHLIITARSDDGLVMAIRHRDYNIRGIQFHPESYMTPLGNQIIRNWLLL